MCYITFLKCIVGGGLVCEYRNFLLTLYLGKKGSVKSDTTLAKLIVCLHKGDQLGIAYLQYGNAIFWFVLNL